MGKFVHRLDDSSKQKRPKNKRTKTEIVFDEKQRHDYLTGFSKRKQERKKVYQEKVIEKLKDEKKQLKLKKRTELDRKWKELNLATDLDHIAEPKTYELPSHMVTVTDVSEVDFVGKSGFMLGNNQGLYDESDDNDDEESGKKTSQGKKMKKKAMGHNRKKNLTHLMTKQNKSKLKKRRAAENLHGGKKKKPKARRNANNRN